MTALAPRKNQMPGARAHASAAPPKTRYEMRTMRLAPSRSAIVPETSWSTAKGIMYAVIAAPTSVSDVSSPSATFGMIAVSIAPPKGPRNPPA
jgi:hypothetical protein